MTDIQPISTLPATPKSDFALAMRRRAATLGSFLALIWIVWLADNLIFRGALEQYGVVPRTLRGLLGILFAPFLHGSWSHIWGNTVGFLLLGGILILRNEEAFWAVSFLGALSAGLGAWLIGKSGTDHIGASGVIFAYFGYLIFAGIFERRFGSILLSLLVFFVWGGMLWSVLPSYVASTISWEEHLFGLAGGLLTARILSKKKLPK